MTRSGWNYPPVTWSPVQLQQKYWKDRGTEHGGVYLDVTHLPSSQIESRLPVMLEQFLKFGVDIRVEPMEVAPTAHHIMGGLRIRPDGATTVTGLFACGEVAGGVHGANRLGGNALAETQVFGKRAGEAAGKAAVHGRNHDPAQVEGERNRLGKITSPGHLNLQQYGDN